MNEPLIRGWCPGARRPMQSGDGLILRLRITGGRVAPALAHAIADIALRYGNGELDLGRRGGLQLRGVRDGSFSAVETELAMLGLIDADAGTEAVRNVVASPLSDLDEMAQGDAFLLAKQLEAALVADESLRQLPGKFGFSVDDGGRFGLTDVSADIRLRFLQDGMAFSLDGDARAIVVRTEEAVATALRLAQAFLDLAARIYPSPRRMAALVGHVGAEAVFAAAGLGWESAMLAAGSDIAPLIGAFSSHVGLGLPFGRLTADQLHLLAETAASDLRLTPFRAILLPGVSADGLPCLAEAGFVTAPDDPLLAVAACPGAPACSSASIETRDLARQLADLKPAARGIWLHISGCEKGCASSAAHAITLVGRDGGLDLVLDGRPTDPPRRAGLTPEAVEALFRSGTVEK